MKPFFFLFLFCSVPLFESYAQMEYNLHFRGDITDWMQMTEAKDSGYTRAVVMERKKDTWDTVHIYGFEKDKIVSERIYMDDILIWDSRTVVEDGGKKVYIKDTHPYMKPESTLNEYDETGLLLKSTDYSENGKINSLITYRYKDGKLTYAERYTKGYDTAIHKFFYDFQGDLVKIVEQSNRYHVTDSVIISIRRDKNNNIIFYCKRPSPTYMKNMHKWCGTGLLENYQAKYDSLGRVTKKTFDFDTLVHIDQSQAYMTYSYGEGVVLERLYSHGEENYFFQSHKRTGNTLFIAENEGALRIEYLSEKSMLPIRVEILSNYEVSDYRIIWER